MDHLTCIYSNKFSIAVYIEMYRHTWYLQKCGKLFHPGSLTDKYPYKFKTIRKSCITENKHFPLHLDFHIWFKHFKVYLINSQLVN